MSKPLQERMNITLDELKELEPEFASDIEAIFQKSAPLYTNFEWVVTRLYLTAYHKGFVNGGIDMGDRIEERLTRRIKRVVKR